MMLSNLLSRESPLFVDLQVRFRGRDEPKDLLALDDVVPDARTTEVDVEIGVAVGHRHQAVLLHLGVLHLAHVVGGLE